MFNDLEELCDALDKLDGGTHAEPTLASKAPPETPAEGTQRPTAGRFRQGIGNEKKVRISGLRQQETFNGKNGQVKAFDSHTGRYTVKVILLSEKNVGLKSGKETLIMLKEENITIHQDQVEKDGVINGDELVLLGAGDAKRALYETKLDPQYWYDKAIDRVLEAKNDFEVLDLPIQYTEDLASLKRQYRKISLAVHPDKNQHPQATDAFRKVYGAFETLIDMKQQRRMLWIMGKLDPSVDMQVTLEEEEEDELFQWWWEASVPQMEKQASEFEGQRYDDFGAMWISDGLGGDVEDVRWVGLETAKSLHLQKGGNDSGAIFLDTRDRSEFIMGHIAGAWCVPLPEIIDFGLTNVFPGDLIHEILQFRKRPIVIYSEVATPFSRCRAFCRWLLRAGHKSIKAERLRRLRGGLFGWKHKHGPVSKPPLEDELRALQGSSGVTSHFAWDARSDMGALTGGVDVVVAD